MVAVIAGATTAGTTGTATAAITEVTAGAVTEASIGATSATTASPRAISPRQGNTERGSRIDQLAISPTVVRARCRG